MKLKVNDQVVFVHAARGTRKQIGTVIEIVKDSGTKYTVKNDANGHIYPCLTIKAGNVGQIIKKIS